MKGIFTERYELAQNGNSETRKLGVRSNTLFSKTVLDYGNRSADVCPVMQAVEQVGHSLSLCV